LPRSVSFLRDLREVTLGGADGGGCSNEEVNVRQITLLDGSIGQELVVRAGREPTPMWSTEVLIEQPELVREVHAEYFRAGATLATTNTYPVLRDRLEAEGLENRLEALWATAVEVACNARDAHGSGRVAGAIGPLVGSYRPDACPPPEQAEILYADIVAALSPVVDLLLFETMSSVAQAEGALRAANKVALPVWLAISVDDVDGTRLRSGEPLSALAPVLQRSAPAALLINCSLPEAVTAGLDIVATFGVPFGAYANGFTQITEAFVNGPQTVDKLTQRRDLDPLAYARFAMQWLDQGASIVGGCCEIGPAHIAELARQIHGRGYEII
tara:strand:+ start:11463 stop:12449 length:987 start_codon:yes stop_codon:yes gene_type:complete